MQATNTPTTGAANGFTFVVEEHIEPSGKNSYRRQRRRYFDDDDDHLAALKKNAGTRNAKLEEAWLGLVRSNRGASVEAMSPLPEGAVEVFTKQNLLVKAVHAAFYDHHPLILSPDIIWITIAQGLANHVSQNAEALRHKFVSHDGKKDLVIQRPDFVKGSPDNDWEGVFPEFASLIAANSSPGTAELLECDFSTTTLVDRLVSQITLMDTVQHYFTYTLCCGCGFPSITLRGAPEDWEKIREKAKRLRDFDLDWWLNDLIPALDQFVATSRGRPNLDFWRSLCHRNVGTSFPIYEPITGWINVFFPYLNTGGRASYGRHDNSNNNGSKDGEKLQMTKNQALGSYAKSMQTKTFVDNFQESLEDDGDSFPHPSGTGNGLALELFPPALSSAPFKYMDLMTGKSYDMAFYGGITSLVQHGAELGGALEPKVGWAVLDLAK